MQQSELTRENDSEVIANYEDIASPYIQYSLFENRFSNVNKQTFPIYAVKFVPDNGDSPTYMKLSKNGSLSFVKPPEPGDKSIDPTFFKNENAAATAIIKLSLMGKAKRRTKGEYEVEKFGEYDETAKYVITKRIVKKYADKGMVMCILENRKNARTDELMDSYRKTKWNEFVPAASASLTFERCAGWETDEVGGFRRYVVGHFNLAEIYAILYLQRAVWYYRVMNTNDLAMTHPYGSCSFLLDKYGIKELNKGQTKIVNGPLEPFWEQVMKNGLHVEYGVQMFGLDYDPFLEYVITRVE